MSGSADGLVRVRSAKDKRLAHVYVFGSTQPRPPDIGSNTPNVERETLNFEADTGGRACGEP